MHAIGAFTSYSNRYVTISLVKYNIIMQLPVFSGNQVETGPPGMLVEHVNLEFIMMEAILDM